MYTYTYRCPFTTLQGCWDIGTCDVTTFDDQSPSRGLNSGNNNDNNQTPNNNNNNNYQTLVYVYESAPTPCICTYNIIT